MMKDRFYIGHASFRHRNLPFGVHSIIQPELLMSALKLTGVPYKSDVHIRMHIHSGHEHFLSFQEPKVRIIKSRSSGKHDEHPTHTHSCFTTVCITTYIVVLRFYRRVTLLDSLASWFEMKMRLTNGVLESNILTDAVLKSEPRGSARLSSRIWMC